MRRYLVLALAAIALAIAAPSAFATRVIFDPPTDPPFPPGDAVGCTHNDPCNVSVLNQPYLVDFLPCSDVEGAVVPTGMSWCLWMNNVTLHTASKFTFQFLVPDGGSHSGDHLECSSLPEGFATDDCPESLPGVDELFTVSFFAPVPNRVNFYLFTDFVNQPDTAVVTISVPEPGQLGLFGLGLLVLGVGFGWHRRRLASRSNEAA